MCWCAAHARPEPHGVSHPWRLARSMHVEWYFVHLQTPHLTCTSDLPTSRGKHPTSTFHAPDQSTHVSWHFRGRALARVPPTASDPLGAQLVVPSILDKPAGQGGNTKPGTKPSGALGSGGEDGKSSPEGSGSDGEGQSVSELVGRYASDGFVYAGHAKMSDVGPQGPEAALGFISSL